uniref:Uncharacterized protein n=1 Tax=Anguilla anguilla TaxID=7936 RepID=A0A0E9T6D3_ANGAN
MSSEYGVHPTATC